VTLELHVSRRAGAEIERIVKWWAENRPAAPGAVRKDLKAALELLLEQPDLGSKVEQASSAGIRRFHLDRVHYWVYYRVRANRLEVVSVWHSSRSAGPAV
jgi:plasmid stabilization system protein ParE